MHDWNSLLRHFSKMGVSLLHLKDMKNIILKASFSVTLLSFYLYKTVFWPQHREVSLKSENYFVRKEQNETLSCSVMSIINGAATLNIFKSDIFIIGSP